MPENLPVPRAKTPEQGSRKRGRQEGSKCWPFVAVAQKRRPDFGLIFGAGGKPRFSQFLRPGAWKKSKTGKASKAERKQVSPLATAFCPTLTLKGLENIASSRAHALLASHLLSALTIFCACIRNECRQRFLYERLQQQQTGQLPPSPGMQLRLLALGISLSKQQKQENAP